MNDSNSQRNVLALDDSATHDKQRCRPSESSRGDGERLAPVDVLGSIENVVEGAWLGAKRDSAFEPARAAEAISRHNRFGD